MPELDKEKSGGMKNPLLNKSFVGIIVIIAFSGVVFYLSIGGSLNLEFGVIEDPVIKEANPQRYSIPNQDSLNDSGGFDPTDFNKLPNWIVPEEFIGDFPTDFSGEELGLPDVVNGTSGGGPGPNPTSEGGTIPTTITFPSPPTTSSTTSTTSTTSSVDVPTRSDTSSQPTNTIITTNEKGNASADDRPDKGRNLPVIEFFDIPEFSFSIPDFAIPSFELDTKPSNLVFVLTLIIIYLSNKFIVPLILFKMEEWENSSIAPSESLFINYQPTIKEQLIIEREKADRLLKFKEHVSEIIEQARINIKQMTPSEMVITTYHELDEAFAFFARLMRSKDITPLEHAKQTFDSGEINNHALENIVNVFYLSRFALKEVSLEEAEKLIDDLVILVIEKAEIEEKIRGIDESLQNAPNDEAMEG
ncbi:MAG: hypothetical protein IH840_06945 [Candidatus Heimdallarchaeota archaeon]|nr:hypothetical protein [Candidatus Heimdallarchaeota archaeon]